MSRFKSGSTLNCIFLTNGYMDFNSAMCLSGLPEILTGGSPGKFRRKHYHVNRKAECQSLKASANNIIFDVLPSNRKAAVMWKTST